MAPAASHTNASSRHSARALYVEVDTEIDAFPPGAVTFEGADASVLAERVLIGALVSLRGPARLQHGEQSILLIDPEYPQCRGEFTSICFRCVRFNGAGKTLEVPEGKEALLFVRAYELRVASLSDGSKALAKTAVGARIGPEIPVSSSDRIPLGPGVGSVG